MVSGPVSQRCSAAYTKSRARRELAALGAVALVEWVRTRARHARGASPVCAGLPHVHDRSRIGLQAALAAAATLAAALGVGRESRCRGRWKDAGRALDRRRLARADPA